MELHRFFRYAIEKMCKEKKSLNHFNAQKLGIMELHRFFRYAIEKMCKEKKSLNHFTFKSQSYGKQNRKLFRQKEIENHAITCLFVQNFTCIL